MFINLLNNYRWLNRFIYWCPVLEAVKSVYYFMSATCGGQKLLKAPNELANMTFVDDFMAL